MPQCPDPATVAQNVILTRADLFIVSIHESKAKAYLEADNKQRKGFTIISISEVKDRVSWENAIPGTGDTYDNEPGLVWVVVVAK